MTYNVIFNYESFLFEEFQLLFAGEEKCEPGYKFGPAARPNYIIHYILEGSGTYYVNNETYQLYEGQGFVIFPNKQTTYVADKDYPWHYVWIGFNGKLSESHLTNIGITFQHPVYSVGKRHEIVNIVRQMLDINQVNDTSQYLFQSNLLAVMAELHFYAETNIKKDQRSDVNPLVGRTLNYIESNLDKSFTINEISKNLFVNRSYLSRIFKKEMGTSLKKYIDNFRVTRAREMLSITEFELLEIAKQTGFTSYNSFYKTFKNITKQTPSQYRHEQRQLKLITKHEA
ncbi:MULTISPECIES: AraC family transcriptional regulator [Staphylococcus]|nr:AraC family transcriptional regulator [Staphylococcus shinii]RQM87503.1 AraC family transcriptional regulator [Staphylococcus xylosus]HLR18837.1 AraC family transcriptional regulator [Staphylococcus sp.]